MVRLNLAVSLTWAGLAVAPQSQSQYASTSEFCLWSPLLVQPPLSCTEAKASLGDVKSRIPLQTNHSSNPWRGPHACSGSYCVYSNTFYANGRGIIVIGHSRNSDAIKKLPDFTKSKPSGTPISEPLFKTTPIPGKGIGVVATQSIHRGQQIMAYKPSVVVHRSFIDDLARDEQYRLLESGIAQLPQATRETFLALMGHTGGPKTLDIMMTNSFEMWLPIGQDGHYFGNFPEVSRYNHDCRPNLQYYIDEEITHYTHAVKYIPAGEELTISYVDSFRARSVRQDRAQHSWSFKCTCSHCNLPEPLANASDNRLWRIYEVENQIADWNSKIRVDTIDLLLSLYQQERLHESHGAGVYELAALNYNAFGNEDLATKYALLALEAELIENGPRSRRVQSMLLLLQDGRGHWTWMKRVKR